MKDKIRHHALELFDERGFYGTSMRDIGEATGCKMPTVYHYYRSKENLFDEIVCNAYIELQDVLHKRFPEKLTPQDYCAESVIQKKALSGDEMLVHRIAMKTWLGCDGCETARQKLMDWEAARNSRNEAMLATSVSSRAWVKIITRTFMNLIERMILFHEDIPDEEIREEMRLVFEAAKIRARGLNSS